MIELAMFIQSYNPKNMLNCVLFQLLIIISNFQFFFQSLFQIILFSLFSIIHYYFKFQLLFQIRIFANLNTYIFIHIILLLLLLLLLYYIIIINYYYHYYYY